MTSFFWIGLYICVENANDFYLTPAMFRREAVYSVGRIYSLKVENAEKHWVEWYIGTITWKSSSSV